MDVKKPANPALDFIAGICAGVSNVLICAPLDTARTRLQIQGLYTPKYSGILQTLTSIYKIEGIRGLYQGMSISLIAYPCSWSMYFFLYEEFKQKFNGYSKYDIVNNTISASLAGIISTIFTNPLWLIRVRMQAQHKNNTPGWQILKDIVRQDGFFSLYRGIFASLLGVIHVAIYFPLYDMCKQSLHHENNPTPLQILMCSTIPKVIASAFSYPHELLRARLFIHDKSYDKRFHGLHGLIWHTYKTEGFKGFYGGFYANLFRILPSTFVTLYTYEKVKFYLENR